ncbi:MAG: hypothetical protein IJS08_13015 [Victivallales bacterium]|nr:hypothetical protein [Victivallales bacterium]
MSSIKKAFLSPSNIFSPSFFWLWNEKLDFKTLKQQIDDMHAHGIRALCPHPFPKGFRPGSMPSAMEPDYLTPGFFDCIAKVMDYAKSLGMHVWLYDEGGWPSGGACGKIIAEDKERFSRRSLVLNEKGEVVEFRPDYHPEYAAPYPSVIEPGVTELFIRLTHEQYRKAIGSHFGKTTLMTFTDEPNMDACINGKRLCWCSDFAEEFEKRKGYDIRPFLKRLIQTKYPGESLQRIRIDYFDVRADLSLERYMLPIREWCHANGMLSSGHLDNENQPSGNTRSGYGHILRSLRAFDVPGIDVIWRQLFPGKEKIKYVQEGARDIEVNNFNPAFPKYASSAAHQNGGKYVLSESLAVYGNGTSPLEIKWVLDYQLARGVNLFVLSAYSMHVKGSNMGAPGMHFGPQHPYWEFMQPIFTYLERMGSMMAQGKPDIDIAVLYDVRSIWAGGKDAQKAIKLHHYIAERLLSSYCDFDYVDDNQLADAAITKDNRLRIGKMKYKAVVIPASKWLKAEAKSKLEHFSRQGGLVCYAPSDRSGWGEYLGELVRIEDNMATFAFCCGYPRPFPKNQLELEKELKKWSGEEYALLSTPANLRVTKRVTNTHSIYFFVNQEMYTVDTWLRFKEEAHVSYCDFETGQFIPLAESRQAFQWRFSPAGSALFLVGKPLSVHKRSVALPFTFNTKTILTIADNWTLQMRRKHYVGKESLVVEDTPDAPVMPTSLGDWRPMLGDEFSGSAFYRNCFRSQAAFDGWLDLGKVHNCAKVIFNGKQLPLKFFGPHIYPVHVRRGNNKLEIIVANSLLNATAPDHVQDYIEKHFPPESPYKKRLLAFSHDDQSSGLFGPVTIRR